MKHRDWKTAATAAALSIVVLAAVPGVATGDGLQQTNAVKMAPYHINNSGYGNEYPWFSNDGKIFLWTRQKTGTTTCDTNELYCQRVYATYIKNWSNLINTPDNAALPDLSTGNVWELRAVNDLVPNNETIKAIAWCQSGTQPTTVGGNTRYTFSLFMAVGKASGGKKIYRAHNVWIDVNPTSKDIVNDGISGAYSHVTGTDVANENETEPMMTRDGQYLFWASSAFAQTRARYITASACAQVAQASLPYDQLPAGNFKWKDQYGTGATPNAAFTSRTNYHTVITNANNHTGLIFEGCQGQVNNAGRDLECQSQNNMLSTTGFAAGGVPTPIAPCASCGTQINLAGNRYTHPAVSGPETGERWLLFYMKNKSIWYTRIKRTP